MNITDPSLATTHVARAIADGERFALPIIIREADFSEGANANTALENALAALDSHRQGEARPVRVDVVARWEVHSVYIDLDDLELPDGFITLVVSLSSPYQFDELFHAGVLNIIRQEIGDRENTSGVSVGRVIYKVARDAPRP